MARHFNQGMEEMKRDFNLIWDRYVAAEHAAIYLSQVGLKPLFISRIPWLNCETTIVHGS